MSIQSLIIDCDPGVDDAVALFLAFAAAEPALLAVTTVGGNVPAPLTQRNARIVRQIAGREDVPVFGGAERPLKRPPAGAGDFHGAEGLGDLAVFEPTGIIGDGPAVNAIVDLVMKRPAGSVVVAVLGPMTNLALAMKRERRLAEHLGPVVVMGGARSEGGNITASAEFNIWADPDAAAVVFGSGCEVIAFGLDATHQVRATEARIRAVETIRTDPARTVAALLRFSQRVERQATGADAPPLHDPCPIAWLMKPDLFTLKPCRIEVETASELTRGHTAVEFRVDPATARHRWAVAADGQGVFDLLTETLKAK
ncbi:MAG: nucleoside hydrolase [Brevundimonas sp.]|uniref:Purine nucleosidase n=1 Tax=Brevundimonas mediterranea TaxID=74329 RepID=A0A7W6A419_9CAUL|nr:nucleoside hydrolase [Brevundimonas sp.]MBB3872299.1 purine nucleosidase [Brevundimonas mediterranea]MDK2748912.1 nucleoside hydrolase [Brevundimonas sp.]